MEYLTTVEMSKQWNITPRRIGVLCAYGIYPEDYETMEAYNKALFDAFVIDDIDENEDTEVPYMFEDTIQKDNKDDVCGNFTSKI